MESTKEERLLIAIVQANPGIQIQHTDTHEIIREIFECTEVHIRAKRQDDYYPSNRIDWVTGEPFQNTRINRRKFNLSI